MSLYHGTSAKCALTILTSEILPSKDGFFYCFDSSKSESLAGALCFATGNGLRTGSLPKHDFVSAYTQENPNFPHGLKGVFFKSALKLAGKSWAKQQLKNAKSPLDLAPAILVYADCNEALHISRKNIINEAKVPASALSDLRLEFVYIDDALLNSPTLAALAQKGIQVMPISAWAAHVFPSNKKPSNPNPEAF